MEAHQQYQRDQGDHHGDLAATKVLDGLIDLLGNRTPHHTLIGPHHVKRAEQHSEYGDLGGALRPEEGTKQDEELADETIEAGQANRRQHHEHEDGSVHRYGLPETAEL